VFFVSLLSSPKQLVMSFAEKGAITACYESNIHRSEADRSFSRFFFVKTWNASRTVNVPFDAQAMKERYVSGISIYKIRKRLVRMLLP